MDANEIVSILFNAPPPWQRPKPCAICRVEFVPQYHWQECCYQHQMAISAAISLMPAPEVMK